MGGLSQTFYCILIKSKFQPDKYGVVGKCEYGAGCWKQHKEQGSPRKERRLEVRIEGEGAVQGGINGLEGQGR